MAIRIDARRRGPARTPGGLAAGLALAALLACAPAAAAAAPPAPSDGRSGAPGLLVFAAASLGDVLEEVDAAFTAKTGVPVKASYAASPVLARQVEAGAHADVFISADRDWMDYLEQRRLIEPGTRRELLGNTLVLIAPADSPVRLTIARDFGLASALGRGRLAIADPGSVPAGRYAQAALTWCGVWDSVEARLAPAENVRAALAFVARGETPLGIVYGTDARAEPRVRVVDTFPADSHLPIAYPVALVVNAAPEARRYEAFLGGEAARAIFVRRGFVVLGAR